MSIIRVSKNKKNPYFLMNKTGINDKRLSLKAKGLLAYLISKPDSWYVNYNDLVSSSLNCIKSVRSAIQELLITGYIVRSQSRSDNGRFGYYDLTVYEQPQKPNYIKNKLAPYSRKRHAVKPHAVKDTLLNNELNIYNDKTAVVDDNNVDNSLAANENLQFKFEKENTIKLLEHLGIKNYQKLFDLYSLPDIFKYATWLLENPRNVRNPTGFIMTAIKERWLE